MSNIIELDKEYLAKELLVYLGLIKHNVIVKVHNKADDFCFIVSWELTNPTTGLTSRHYGLTRAANLYPIGELGKAIYE